MNTLIEKHKIKASYIVIEVILAIIALFVIYPVVLLFLTTFKQVNNIYNPFVIPDFRNISNYIGVYTRVNIPAAFLNTAVIAFSTIAINILISSMAGYAISRSKEKIIKLLFFYFIFGLIIPFQSSMIILYKMGTLMNLINTRTFLVLMYVAGGCAYAILLYVGFTKNVPRELEEAASIDGYGLYQTFFKIVFPLLRPATLTLATITIFWYWNDFAGPLIYLNDQSKQTIMYAIFLFQLDQRSAEVGQIYTLCFISIIPILIFFFFTQKFLIAGLASGAVKG